MILPGGNIEEIISVWDEASLRDQAFRSILILKINELIQNNFNLLVQLLYRIDVDESRLKKVLSENASEVTAPLIAGLMIDRQLQKIKLRKEMKKNDIDEEDNG
ncbi:MAG: hypothetical protein ABIP80_01460 [Ferruginibacter sp.]